MVAKAGKRKKVSIGLGDGETRKERASTVDTGNDEAATSSESSEPMGARIEKTVEERLARVEANLKKRTKSRPKKRSPRVERAKHETEEEEHDVPVEELKHGSDDSSSEDSSDDSSYVSMHKSPGLLRELVSIAERTLLPGSRARDYERTVDVLRRMDEFGKVPDIENRLVSLMTFLYEKYWRVETSGIENIPDEGRTLIVSNHSGVIPFDGAMMATAIYNFHPAKRQARFLIEDWFGQLPFATAFMNAVGQVRACQENAERLLRQEQLVGVFPEGIKGMAKGFKDRYNLARFGRGGVIRLVLRTKTPVVPCAVVGAEEIYIVLGYANWLGKLLGMPLLPITPTFPWLGPLGMIPMPTKWYIQFGEVIRYDEYDESALKDNVIINRLNRELRATVQDMLDTLLKKRRSLFFG
jgi:1-acyl-sn-glycerol-3-phosphate acyltransferase